MTFGGEKNSTVLYFNNFLYTGEGLVFVEHHFPFCEHRQPSSLDDLLGTEETDLQENRLATAREFI